MLMVEKEKNAGTLIDADPWLWGVGHRVGGFAGISGWQGIAVGETIGWEVEFRGAADCWLGRSGVVYMYTHAIVSGRQGKSRGFLNPPEVATGCS